MVSTNNRSYQRSGNSEQHLALSQMRAAETGRPVLQASVSGISAVIDPDGSRARHDRACSSRRSCTATVPTTTGETPYVRFGDWVVLLGAASRCWSVTVIVDRAARRASRIDQQLDRGDQADHHDHARAARAPAAAGRWCAPNCAPTTEPTAMSAATSHATSAKNTNSDRGDTVGDQREHVLHRR